MLRVLVVVLCLPVVSVMIVLSLVGVGVGGVSGVLILNRDLTALVWFVLVVKKASVVCEWLCWWKAENLPDR